LADLRVHLQANRRERGGEARGAIIELAPRAPALSADQRLTISYGIRK
jgi:hypothetical protein